VLVCVCFCVCICVDLYAFAASLLKVYTIIASMPFGCGREALKNGFLIAMIAIQALLKVWDEIQQSR
jgi:hypothetical protein